MVRLFYCFLYNSLNRSGNVLHDNFSKINTAHYQFIVSLNAQFIKFETIV